MQLGRSMEGLLFVKLTLIIGLTWTVVASQHCDEGWISSPFGSCYKFVTEKKVNWIQAGGLCADMKSHLVTLDSMDEILWMKGLRSHHPALRGEEVWAGGYKKGGQWLWKGDLDDSPMLVTDWGAGEPNNYQGNQECLQLYADTSSLNPATQWYRFDDAKCDGVQGYVCEKKN